MGGVWLKVLFFHILHCAHHYHIDNLSWLQCDSDNRGADMGVPQKVNSCLLVMCYSDALLQQDCYLNNWIVGVQCLRK